MSLVQALVILGSHYEYELPGDALKGPVIDVYF